jgi:hypothetical protein
VHIHTHTYTHIYLHTQRAFPSALTPINNKDTIVVSGPNNELKLNNILSIILQQCKMG